MVPLRVLAAALLPFLLGCIQAALAQTRYSTTSLRTAVESFKVLDQDQDGCISEEEIGRYAELSMPDAVSIPNELDLYCLDTVLGKGGCNPSTLWSKRFRVFSSVFVSCARKVSMEVWARCFFVRSFLPELYDSIDSGDVCFDNLSLARTLEEAAYHVWAYSSRLHKFLDYDNDDCLSLSEMKNGTTNTKCTTLATDLPTTNPLSTCYNVEEYRKDIKKAFEWAVLDLLTLTPNLEGSRESNGREYLTISVLAGVFGSLALCMICCTLSILYWRRKRRRHKPADIEKFQDTLEVNMANTVEEDAAGVVGETSKSTTSVSDSHSRTSAGQFASCNWHYILSMSDRDHWLVAADELSFNNHAGPWKQKQPQGAFGSVRRGLLRGVTQVAVKEPRIKVTHADVAQIVNEARLFRRMRHPNIVLFYGMSFLSTSTDGIFPVLVLEWVEGGDFSDFMRSMYPPDLGTQQSATYILLDITRAMAFLHGSKPPILHLDIKPSNVLVERSMPRRGKVTDFGLSRHISAKKDGEGRVGTLKYMAPEIMGGERGCYDMPADVFSFGCVMIFAMLGEHRIEYSAPEVVLPLLRSGEVSKHMQDTIVQCLAVDTTSRPTFIELFERLESILDESTADALDSSTPSQEINPVAL
eukprot:TRINITY_DN32702_c0_g1_i1.p1 TRINITY_DN32702_c0_g1~~TRINITY_DN32702_c0_g1_i1.p1  ORF type:complete len:641 (-),score=76.24 TRINITY_DN32702_c0_g1_i1:108-2030(-)